MSALNIILKLNFDLKDLHTIEIEENKTLTYWFRLELLT